MSSRRPRGSQKLTWLDGLTEPALETLNKPPVVEGKVVSIEGPEYIGSYNWTDTKKPTIIVPGSPRVWRDRLVPYEVPPDKGWVFADQNGYRLPSSTLLPLFRAVDTVSEESNRTIDWRSVDVITDRNCLRNLLRWIKGSSSHDFRIDTQLVGEKTVLLSRWSIYRRERMDPEHRRSYGFSFENESTDPAPGCEEGTAHHRIVQYKMDGLALIVRFEVDACLAGPSPSTAGESTADDVENILPAMESLSLSASGQADARRQGKTSTTELDIIHAGSIVPQSSIIELTTAKLSPAESFPQMFLSKTPYIYQGVHDGDTFYHIKKQDMDNENVRDTRERMQKEDFVQLAEALRMIQALLLEHGRDARLTLVSLKKALHVYKRASPDSCLPDAVLRRFDA